MYASVASQKSRGKLHKKLFERINESKLRTSCKNQNGEHLANM